MHVGLIFTAQEIEAQIAWVEREQRERDAEIGEAEEVFAEDPASAAERSPRFATIKQLLTARELGTL